MTTLTDTSQRVKELKERREALFQKAISKGWKEPRILKYYLDIIDYVELARIEKELETIEQTLQDVLGMIDETININNEDIDVLRCEDDAEDELLAFEFSNKQLVMLKSKIQAVLDEVNKQ